VLPKWERMHHNAGYLKEEKVTRKSIEELVKAWDMLPENWTTLSERTWYHGSAKEVAK